MAGSGQEVAKHVGKAELRAHHIWGHTSAAQKLYGFSEAGVVQGLPAQSPWAEQ